MAKLIEALDCIARVVSCYLLGMPISEAFDDEDDYLPAELPAPEYNAPYLD